MPDVNATPSAVAILRRAVQFLRNQSAILNNPFYQEQALAITEVAEWLDDGRRPAYDPSLLRLQIAQHDLNIEVVDGVVVAVTLDGVAVEHRVTDHTPPAAVLTALEADWDDLDPRPAKIDWEEFDVSAHVSKETRTGRTYVRVINGVVCSAQSIELLDELEAEFRRQFAAKNPPPPPEPIGTNMGKTVQVGYEEVNKLMEHFGRTVKFFEENDDILMFVPESHVDFDSVYTNFSTVSAEKVKADIESYDPDSSERFYMGDFGIIEYLWFAGCFGPDVDTVVLQCYWND